MPNYNHICNKCDTMQVQAYSMHDPDWDNKVFPCVDIECPGKAERTMIGIVPRFIKKGAHWPDKERKLDNHMKDVHRIQNEPTCRSEIKEGLDMLKEREKEKGYPEGYLSGNRPKEKVLVDADNGALIDKTKLAKSANERLRDAERRDPSLRKGVNIRPDEIKTPKGDKPVEKIVQVEMTKLQGKEKLKERAQEQSRIRRKTPGGA